MYKGRRVRNKFSVLQASIACFCLFVETAPLVFLHFTAMAIILNIFESERFCNGYFCRNGMTLG